MEGTRISPEHQCLEGSLCKPQYLAKQQSPTPIPFATLLRPPTPPPGGGGKEGRSDEGTQLTCKVRERQQEQATFEDGDEEEEGSAMPNKIDLHHASSSPGM